jgi:DNA-binding NarL/FixJ family response regulator
LIKVEIVETRPVYLRGLIAVLSDAGMKVVSARTSLNGQRPWRTDVLVLDPAVTADPGSVAAVASIAHATPVLVLTSGPDAGVVDRFLAAGVSGSVRREAEVDELLEAIHTVVRGGRLPASNDAPATAPATAPADVSVPEADGVSLSPREQQVLRQIARGRTHSQIARALGISHHTVDTYVKRIRSKLDLGNKAELTRAAVLGGY